MTARQEKAFSKYDAAYCRKHLRSIGSSWFLEIQYKKIRSRLMLRGHDMDLLAAQASERARCMIAQGWNAMWVKYYTINPTLGEHIRKCRKFLEVDPRTLKGYENAARRIMRWLHGDLDDPCKYGRGKNGRALKKLIEECKLSDFTIIGLRRFAAKEPKANGHLHHASCLFTPTIIGSLYGEKLREPWPFVEFTSKALVVRPLVRFEESEFEPIVKS